MSTLKTHNLQSPDSASANIALTPNAGMVIAGLSTYSEQINVGSNIKLGNAGVITATSFSGDGSSLTGIDATQIVTGNTSVQTIDTGSDGQVKINIEGTERLRIATDGRATFYGTNEQDIIHITTGNAAGNTFANIRGDNEAGIRIRGGGSYDGGTIELAGGLRDSDPGLIKFSTGTGSSVSERLRIASDGNIGIGTNNPTEQLEIYKGTSSADATFRMRSLDGSTKITLDARGTNDSNIIYFTNSSAAYNSFIQRSHSSNANFAGLRYCYNGSASEAFRISESGGFDMGGNGYGTAGQVLKSNGNAPPTWSGGAQRVLEVVASPCDGSTIATSNGNVTFQNVTAVQNLSTTFSDLNGSKITYTPPTGTTQVIYEFTFQMSKLDALAISHYRMYIDGNEVTYARSEIAGEDICVRTTIKWIFNIGGSTNNATGRQSSWTSGKEIKLQAEDYGSSYDVQLHETNWWNGTGTDQFSMPLLSLTAIGI